MADNGGKKERQRFVDIAAPVGMIVAVLGGLVAIVLEFSL